LIRILEDRVVNRIAAGEVVERPAAVVKELVENSLDAGATDLRVALRAGGRDLIQVTDNGIGMSRQDATLCLERHATSKIREFEDLETVRTLGFRGEALPSIASVSRFTLRTRPAEDDVGTRVTVEGGRLTGVREDGGPRGTSISVRSLFFNVPARRKFLRTVPTELSHCVEAVRRQTLMRPEVDVEVLHDGRSLLRAPATEDRRARLRDILGSDAEELLALDAREGELRIVGHVAPHDVHRNSATGAAYHFVNGRFVRDPLLRRAVAEAYRGLMPRGRHPVVVIDVQLPTDLVDCNVHPAKTEVRFADGRAVQRVVAAAIRSVLEDRGIKRRGAPRPVSPPHQRDHDGPAQLTLTGEELPPQAPLRPPTLRPAPAPPPPPEDRQQLGEPAAPQWRPAPTPLPTPRPPAWSPRPAHPAAVPVAPPAEPTARAFRELRVLGSLSAGQVVCADGPDLVLVDQAAAQRALVARELAAGGAPRPLPEPAVVHDQAPLGDSAERLRAVGLEASMFGEDAVLVRTLPAALSALEPATVLTAARAAAPEGLVPALAALAPVAGGAGLSPYELRSLMRRLDAEGLSLDAPPEGVVLRLSGARLVAALAAGRL
jgi:DNA mismatch repair protein MutL